VIKDAADSEIGTGVVDRKGTGEVTLNWGMVGGEELRIEVTDAAGNTGSNTVTADMVTPVVTGDQTGPNTIEVTSDEAGTVVIKDAAGTEIGTGVVDANGTVEVTLNRDLVDGEEISIEVTDAAGNTGSNTVTADMVTPVVTGDQTGPNTIEVTSDEAGTVVIKDATGTEIGTGVVDANGTVEVTLNRDLVDGEEISIEVTDAAGNTGRDTLSVIIFNAQDDSTRLDILSESTVTDPEETSRGITVLDLLES